METVNSYLQVKCSASGICYYKVINDGNPVQIPSTAKLTPINEVFRFKPNSITNMYHDPYCNWYTIAEE
jgi:hypothetical protein